MKIVLLALLSFVAYAQTTVYLRYGTPGGYSKITNATNATPIVVTTAEAHGFSNGDLVWIQGLYGNWNANGLRKVASVTSTTFALTDTSDVNIAGNGTYAHNGIVGRVQAYTIKDHPRMMLDGPGGTWTTKFASPSIKAVTGWAPWDALVTSNEITKAGGASYNLGDNARDLAFGWFMDNTRTSWRDAAIQMITEIDKKVACCTSGRNFYPGIYAATTLGRGSDTDWASMEPGGYMLAYSLVRDAMSAGQKSTFADKMLNNADDYGATCSKNETVLSGTASTVTGTTAVTGTGTDFTTITPGSIVLLHYQRLALYSSKTHWTRVSSVSSATSMTIENAAPYTEGNIQVYVVRPWQTGDCGWRWYTRGYSFSPTVDRRRFTFTLAAPVSPSDTTITASAAPPKAYPYLIQVDNGSAVEVMAVTGAVGNVLSVTRGAQNTVAGTWTSGRVVYVADPLENFGWPGTKAGASAVEEMPYDDPRHNLVLSKIYGNILVSLALADDDERAREMFQANFNYWYDTELPFNKRSWTGMTQAGTSPMYNSRHHLNIYIATVVKNSLTPSLDTTGGEWLQTLMMHLPSIQMPGWTNRVWSFSNNSDLEFIWRHAGGAMLSAALFPDSDYAQKFNWWFRTKMNKWNTAFFNTGDNRGMRFHALFHPSPNETPIGQIDYTAVDLPDFTFKTVDQNDAKTTPLAYWHSRSDWTDQATTIYAGVPFVTVDHITNYPGPGAYKVAKGNIFLSGDVGALVNDIGMREFTNYMKVGTARDYGANGMNIDRNKATAALSYIRVNTSTAYPTDRAVTRAHRHMLHVKGSADVIITYDHLVTSSNQVRSKQEHTYSDGNEAPSWSRAGCKAIHTRPTSNARLVVQMVGSGFTCSEVLPAMVSGRTHNKLVAEFPATTSAGMFTVSKAFLNTTGDVTDIAAIGTISSSHEGVEIPSLEVVAAMPTNGNAVSTSLTYAASAAADHYVGGMSSGTYDVTLDATPIASGVTVDTDGMLLFTAAGGGTIAIARSDVPPPLEVVTASVPNPKVGVAYSYTLAAAGGTDPYSWSATGAPSGLTLSSAGVLSGTPTTDGQSTMATTVTDALTDTANRNISVTVDEADPAPPPALTITTGTLATGTKNRPYTYTLEAAGGTAPYTWTLVSTSCTGLTLSAATITWDSAIFGQCAISVSVEDAALESAEATFQLTVQDEQSLPNPPSVSVRAVGALLEIRYGKAGLANSQICTITTQNVSYTDMGGLASRVAYLTVPESTTHTLRVDCGGAFTDTSLATTTALTGTASYSIYIGPSPYANAALDYSTDGSSWTSGTPVSCASGCTLTAADLSRGVAYWVRLRRRDASNDLVIGKARRITVQ